MLYTSVWQAIEEDGTSIYCNNLWFQVLSVILDTTDVDLYIWPPPIPQILDQILSS